MTKLTDEILMYYADGLLSVSEVERVEKLLADDPELRMRVEIFRATGRRLARALEEDDGVPASQKLQDFVLGLGVRAAARRRNLVRRSYRLAAIVSAALLAGMGLGWLLQGTPPGAANGPSGFVRTGSAWIVAGPLRRALDAAPSGGETALTLPGGGEARLTIKMTFRNGARNYCRKYEIAARLPDGCAAVACRLGGQWSVQFQAPPPLSGHARDGIRPAGVRNPAMDAAVGALMDGDPLGPDEEAAVLRGGWKK
jgi:hypothetical protein